VGYYTGIIVRCYHAFRESRISSDGITDVAALCYRGDYRALLESPFRSHWPQAGPLGLPRGYDHLDRFFRFLPLFLDDHSEVLSAQTLDCAIRSRTHHSRCLHGATKGSMSVVKSAMAELTDETNMAHGFSLVNLTWSVGYIIGSATLPLVPCLC
jgi:hypothetical protein